MEKFYYNISEIIFGLRDEYIKNQQLLEELKRYVEVSDGKVDKELYCREAFDTCSNEIYARISKRQNELQKMLHHIGVELTVLPANDLAPHYRLIKKDGKYKFVLNEPNDKQYDVRITKQGEFKDIADELYNSPLMKTEKAFFKTLTEFADLSVGPNIIIVWNNLALFDKSAPIMYIPSKDLFYVDPGKVYNECHIKSLLEEGIMKENVPEGFRSTIDKNLENYPDLYYSSNLKIDCDINRRMELSINKEYGKVLLKKKRNVRFYE